jgi:hypothetical protein
MNGASACRLLPDPPSAPEPGKPAADPARAAIENAIGETTADACTVLAAAMIAFHETGRLTPETKSAGGEKIARLAQLELDLLGEPDDFAGIAHNHKEGGRRLRGMLDTEYFLNHGAAGSDAVITNLISGALEISQRVVRLEKVLMRARAH